MKNLVELDPENIATRIKLAELYSKEGLVDDAVTKQSLYAHAGVQVILHLWERLDLALFGIGGRVWGDASFGSYFFLMTGFHGTHVLTGVIILVTTAARLAMGKTTRDGVEMAGLYWHFVDLVWMFIFPLVYLMSTKIT